MGDPVASIAVTLGATRTTHQAVIDQVQLDALLASVPELPRWEGMSTSTAVPAEATAPAAPAVEPGPAVDPIPAPSA